MMLDADPNSDQVMLSVLDAGSDVNYILWSGSVWGTPSEQETNAGDTKNQPFLFLWDGDGSPPATYDISGSIVVAVFGGALGGLMISWIQAQMSHHLVANQFVVGLTLNIWFTEYFFLLLLFFDWEAGVRRLRGRAAGP